MLMGHSHASTDRIRAERCREAGGFRRPPLSTKTDGLIVNGVPLTTTGRSGRSVQGAYCRVTCEEFERMAQTMRVASGQ